jgi:SAM-dependent methyltransferase
MLEAEIREGLRRLQPDVPWAHHFDLGFGIETVSPTEEKFYSKAVGLRKLGDFLVDLVRDHTQRRTFSGLRALDVASGEGAHSIRMAQLGADVLGVEGRQLYVDRATFVASVLGFSNVRFRQADVRRVGADDLGKFELVLCSGILHHLGSESFAPMLRTLADLTQDTLVLYTHISTPASVERFRLKGPLTTPSGHQGYLFREHDEKSKPAERLQKVRASIDNPTSFWATEETLLMALREAGFRSIVQLRLPHLFSAYADAAYRPLLVVRK